MWNKYRGGGITISKLNKIGHYDKETGEIIDDGMEVIASIQKEERNSTIKALCWKIENKPFEMTLDEIMAYRLLIKKKSGEKVKYKLKRGEFITLIKKDSNSVKELNTETKAMLYEVSMTTNKSGILMYGNNKPIPSFEKLRLFLNIGHSKWSKIKEDIDKHDLVVKRKDKNNRNVLVMNPFYTLSSTEVTEIRFITFGHLLKDRLDFEDYLFLCKKYDIVPEFDEVEAGEEREIVVQ